MNILVFYITLILTVSPDGEPPKQGIQQKIMQQYTKYSLKT
jgi:hypothetical protein